MPINTETYYFADLSPHKLYEILKRRQEIFIVEQNCLYVDCDDKDQNAHHVLLLDGETVVAASRVLAPGISYTEYSSIGRVVVKDTYRGQGLGKKIMEEAILLTQKLYPSTDIKISSQCYATGMYEKVGFTQVGESYMEDGIPHIGMILYSGFGMV
jgi:ElaA protein